MKAAVCYGGGIVRYEDWETPETLPGTVKIRVREAGICGSDLIRALGQGAHYYPIILGHELAGIVEEVGEGVTKVKREDHVVGVPLIPCFKCEDCRNHNYSLCKHYSFIGSREAGAFADYVLVPEANAFRVDSTIPFGDAVFFEPSTVALHGLLLTDYQPGKTAVVLGGGTIGIFTLQWAKILGARKVVVIGRDKNHLELSLRMGADAVVSTLDDGFMEKALQLSDKAGYDYVFEAAGSTSTMGYVFQLAANKAKVCFIGTPTENFTVTPKIWEQINRKELMMVGSWMSYSSPFPGYEWEMTDKHFSTGQLWIDPQMVYRRLHMSQAQIAFDLFRSHGKVKGRVVLCND